MTRDTFQAATYLAYSTGEGITIGGGEPTLHPLFWDFIGLSMSAASEVGICVITNGSVRRTALQLAYLAKKGIFAVDLSQDRYHDAVDDDVVIAFERHDRHSYDRSPIDLRGIRRGGSLIAMGRAIDNQLSDRDGCTCDDLFVVPDGRIFACAHQELGFGTVHKPGIPEYYSEADNKCSRRFVLAAAA
jgi:hypothetical protein